SKTVTENTRELHYFPVSWPVSSTSTTTEPFSAHPTHRPRRNLASSREFELKMEGKKKSTSSFVSGEAGAVPRWAQRTVTLPSHKRGCHLVTPTILKDVEADLANFKCGLAHFFLQHTSASLTINENYDSDVLDDVETWLTGTVPEGRKAPWKHTIEGPDDMPAHIKSSVFGCALSIPITDGRLNLGTWQGIWLCEHRDHASARKVVITMTGV
ncbi:hypothetical protein KC19_6G115000, partial [Ceratodon purpureus]